MKHEHRYVRSAVCQGYRGAGFAGPLVAPPEGEAPKALRGGGAAPLRRSFLFPAATWRPPMHAGGRARAGNT